MWLLETGAFRGVFMAKLKLTKSAVDAAQPQAQAVELRDTMVPGFLCKTTPAGRKVFMLQYRTNAGERRKPALGLYGELTVEQARALAQEWLAEVWGNRTDGTNPYRHVPMYPNGKATHLISDEDMAWIFRHLGKLEAEELEPYVIPLAIRLQFEFAARRGEIVTLQWDWVDFENRRVVWPDSKIGGMSKPMSEEAYRLLSPAPRQDGIPHVLPSPNHKGRHLTTSEYYNGWCRALKAAGAAHVGTHGIRLRSATALPIRGFRSRSAWR